jgi:hypothetical protein
VTFCDIIFAVTPLIVLKYAECKKSKIIFRGKWIHVGKCLKIGDITHIFSVFIFNFIVYGKQKTFIYKK